MFTLTKSILLLKTFMKSLFESIVWACDEPLKLDLTLYLLQSTVSISLPAGRDPRKRERRERKSGGRDRERE